MVLHDQTRSLHEDLQLPTSTATMRCVHILAIVPDMRISRVRRSCTKYHLLANGDDIYNWMGTQPIEIRPPCIDTLVLCCEWPYSTYDRVVLAADRRGVTSTTAPNADDGDWGAIDAEQDVKVAHNDTEQAEEGVTGGGAGLHNIVLHEY